MGKNFNNPVKLLTYLNGKDRGHDCYVDPSCGTPSVIVTFH